MIINFIYICVNIIPKMEAKINAHKRNGVLHYTPAAGAGHGWLARCYQSPPPVPARASPQS